MIYVAFRSAKVRVLSRSERRHISELENSFVEIIFRCPQCSHPQLSPLDASTRELVCVKCKAELSTPVGAVTDTHVNRCVVCPSEELYARKDFPQQLGVAIVVVGVILSTIAWYYRQIFLTYGIFFATAILDFVLWLVMGNVLQCYRCQAQYRGVAGLDTHGGFDLETHEKHRQQLIRLAEAEAATAGKIAGKPM